MSAAGIPLVRALAAIAAFATAAAGYTLNDPPYKVLSGSRTIQVDDRGHPSLTAVPDRGVSAAVRAASAWNGPGLTVTAVPARVTTYRSGDSKSTLLFSDPFGECAAGDCLAFTRTRYGESSGRCGGLFFWNSIESDTVFTDRVPMTVRDAPEPCVRSFLLEPAVRHEVGHGIGLDHTDVIAAMQPVLGECHDPGITADDLAGRDAIYGCVCSVSRVVCSSDAECCSGVCAGNGKKKRRTCQ